jgi:type IV secretion system protein VirB4
MNPFIKALAKIIYAKKTTKTLAIEKPDKDFIPYAIHYDKNTLLTKNGELMQIIRVVGFSNASVFADLISLREAVRDGIRDNIKQTNYAIWFTTIRRKKNISPEGEFREFFSQKINQTWEDVNNLKNDYVNELYITIITEGLDTSIVNINSFIKSFSSKATLNLHKNFLSKSHENLVKVTQGVLSSIIDYGAKLLEITEHDGVIYSDQMSFLGKICNLEDKDFTLKFNDISEELFFNRVAFGNKEINIISENKRYYGAIMSLKEYIEISLESLDKILQLPFDFIITQAFDFFYNESDLDEMKYQDNILRIGGNQEFRDMIKLTDFFESVDGNVTDYGKLQTTLMLISKSSEELDNEVKLISEKFQSLGLVIIREDVFLEDCYWAQLPGNFKFLKRQKIINSYRVGGFASLYSFASGAITGNYWGPALTTFKTINNTPYFFNFHESDNGHALFIGGNGCGKTVLVNFILAQTRRYNNKFYYIDFHNKSRNFIEMIGGFYYDLSFNEDHKHSLKINPFLMANNPTYRKFLGEFFYSLIYQHRQDLAQGEIQLINDIVDDIITKKINNFIEAIKCFDNDRTKNIYAILKFWEQPELSKIFSYEKEINWNDRMMGFDFTEYYDQEFIRTPILYYLLHRIENSLDGKTPSVVVFKDADIFLSNEIFLDKIISLLERFRQKNALIIFSINADAQKTLNPKLLSLIIPKLSAKFILSDSLIDNDLINLMKLNEEEIRIANNLKKKDHKFLLKFAENSLILNFDLASQIPLLKLLSSSYEDIAILEEIFNHAKAEGKVIDNEIAINQFYEIIKQLDDERKAEEAKINRQNKLAQMKKLREIRD